MDIKEDLALQNYYLREAAAQFFENFNIDKKELDHICKTFFNLSSYIFH